VGRHEPFHRVQYLDDALPVPTDHGYPDHRPTVQITVVHLGHRDIELPADLRDERAHHRALLFEGMHIPEENIEFTGSGPHMGGKPSAPGDR
jgi:hypothetical protein